MNLDKRYINQIEVIIPIFTIDKNELKIYLIKRVNEPYKGYWILPSNLLMTTETIEECASDTVRQFLGVENIFLKQCSIFSQIDRMPNDRIIANSMLGLIDIKTLTLHKTSTDYEGVWFSLNEIPKMVFDHKEIIDAAIKYLSEHIDNLEFLKVLFPSDFTIPELQSIYEQLLNKKLDRRNFRKKIIDSIVETGDKISNKMGRPAKLYRFKGEDIHE